MKTFLFITVACGLSFTAQAQVAPSQDSNPSMFKPGKVSLGVENPAIYVVDNKIVTAEEANRISSENISVIKILKDSASTAPYNLTDKWRPVIEITLRKPPAALPETRKD
jgi:hypothetical protein